MRTIKEEKEGKEWKQKENGVHKKGRKFQKDKELRKKEIRSK